MKLSDLKPLFWKEWHENIRWAALALLALSLGLTYAVYHEVGGGQFSYNGAIPVWGSVNLVMTIGAPLVGIVLGLLQVLPELRRDQWAFLVHRPVPRTTLFFGKVLPGVCLYLLATIPPLLVFAFWASFPSHIPAPFDFRFTLAGWAAILSGLPFYFAGLLVALRPARWYGSRALPILAAVAGPWAANWFGEFWQAALGCALTAAILLLATWGSFVTGGEYKEQTKPARFVLGLILYPACLAVGVGVLMLLNTYRLLGGQNGGEWSNSDYKIDTQGQILEHSEQGTDIAHMDQKTVTVSDLAGHSVDPRVWDNLNRQHKLLNTVNLAVHPGAENYVQSYQRTERYVSYLTSDYNNSLWHFWYYASSSRQITLYTVPSSGLPVVHYLGPNGFSESSRQAGQFPDGMPSRDSFASLMLLCFRHSLFWYDPSRPAVGLVQSAPSPAEILGTASSDEAYNYENAAVRDVDRPAAYFVAADHQITVYARNNREAAPGSARRLFTTPLAFSTQYTVQVAVTPDLSRFFFWYQGEWPARTNHIITVAADGQVLKTETVLSPVPQISQVVATRSRAEYILAMIYPPALIPTVTFYAFIGHALGWSSAEGFRNAPDDYWLVFLVSCLSGLVAAVLAWRISRRCGDSRRGQIAWAVGVFWLGGYGVLLLLALRAWPARVPCPNCGRLRVVDRALCEHCGAAFANPKRDGTEIFEGAGEEAIR